MSEVLASGNMFGETKIGFLDHVTKLMYLSSIHLSHLHVSREILQTTVHEQCAVICIATMTVLINSKKRKNAWRVQNGSRKNARFKKKQTDYVANAIGSGIAEM